MPAPDRNSSRDSGRESKGDRKYDGDRRNDRNITHFDYKDFKLLQRYVDPYGKILPRKRTGFNARQQNRLAVAVKRSRHIALLPFVAN